MRILIYSDNVSSNGTLYFSLGKLYGKENVQFINANDILNGALSLETSLFVMPGGASRYKAAKLSGAGHRFIREYVESGGSYLGICAGAYSACAVTEWAKGTKFELIGPNELNFFDATAVGPIKDFSEADSYNGSDARLVQLDVGNTRIRSLYWGGCRFVPNGSDGYEVVATFGELPDRAPAIVKGRLGAGHWLLSSTHIEYDADALDLIKFDVEGNDYKDIAALGEWSDITLDLFEILIRQLVQ